jgi:hypothetical protein
LPWITVSWETFCVNSLAFLIFTGHRRYYEHDCSHSYIDWANVDHYICHCVHIYDIYDICCIYCSNKPRLSTYSVHSTQ